MKGGKSSVCIRMWWNIKSYSEKQRELPEQIVVLTLKLCVCYCLACLWLLPAPRLFSFVSLPNDTLKKTDLTAPRRTMTPSPLSLLVNLQATSGPWDLAPFPTHTCLPHLNIKRHYLQQAKLDDLEARSRRQNIRVVGIKEKMENGRPMEFISQVLPKLLGEEHFNLPIEVDQAHRSLAPAKDSKARAIIARIHYYQLGITLLYGTAAALTQGVV
ncbi:uncharacterized protein LOC119020713 [Acanthopagrus latus]|uniref:uncharacterized protein LOC119020713 n=1 Tax=Acanthopagrus latus TaxID=8177 RepID=UPI00187BE4D1|nr:uncharacterized protein LOC119020713 [Acanthopagrus latus]